jgi:hypothetical protein
VFRLNRVPVSKALPNLILVLPGLFAGRGPAWLVLIDDPSFLSIPARSKIIALEHGLVIDGQEDVARAVCLGLQY